MKNTVNSNRARVSRALIFLLGVLLLSALLVIWSQRGGRASEWIGDLRSLKMQQHKVSKIVNLLKDHKIAVATIREEPKTVASLTLSLIETLNQQATQLNVVLNSLTVIDSAGVRFGDGMKGSEAGVPLSDEYSKKSFSTLRVDFSVDIARANDLLSLLDAASTVADWRPMEIRACKLSRREDDLGLLAACSVDVYYFSGLDV